MKTNLSLCTLAACIGLPITLLAQGSLTPPGAPALTMKTLDQVEARIPVDTNHTPGNTVAYFIISQPGSYYMTGNLTASNAAKVGIEIYASDVTLDLNGYILDGVTNGTAGVQALSRQNISIFNGVVKNWTARGIDFVTAMDSSAENIKAIGNGSGGIVLWQGGMVRKCIASYNGAAGGSSAGGIVVGQSSSVIECVAQNNTGSGVYGIALGDMCNVNNSVANLNNGLNGGGIKGGYSCNLVNCTASENNGTNAIAINMVAESSVVNCVCSLNYSSGTNSIGILAGPRCRISGCNICETSGDGIKADDNCILVQNSVMFNNGSGIHAFGSRCLIEDNSVIVNAHGGIKLDSTGSFISRNKASANSGLDYIIPAGNGDAQRWPATTGFSTTNAWANFTF